MAAFKRFALAFVALLLVSGSYSASAARLLKAPLPSPRPVAVRSGQNPSADSVPSASGDRASATAQSQGAFVWGSRGPITTAGQQSQQAVVTTTAGGRVNPANPSQPALVEGRTATAGNMQDSVSATAGSNSFDLTQANSAASDDSLNPTLYTRATGNLNGNGASFATQGGSTIRAAAVGGNRANINGGLTGLADNLDNLSAALAVSGGTGGEDASSASP